ncbi:MAG: AsmA family protein [Desulfurivibrionaceae bacterium]
MKKLIKIGGIAAGVIIVLLVVVVLLANFLITPERVRTTVLPIAEKSLQREVSSGEIEVSLFSGIVLRDFTVKDKEGEENFVAVDEVELRYQFLPLFFMKVVVDEVRLEGPKIRVVRKGDGTFNFSDLLGAEEREKTAPPAEKTDGGPPINLLVTNLNISQGELFFQDHAVNGQSPYSYKLEDLGIKVSNLALDKSFPYSVKARLKDAPLKIKGEMNLRGPGGSAEVTLSDFDLTAFQPYFRDSFPGSIGSSKIDLDLRAEGGMDQVSSQGNIVLSQIDLTLDDMEDAPVRGARFSLDYDLSSDLKAAVLTLNKAAADLNGIKINAAGEISDYTSAPLVDLTVNLPALKLTEALAAAPESLVKDISSMDPAGTVNAELNLSGPAGKPGEMLEQGVVELASVQAGVTGHRPQLSGKIDLKGDSLSSRDLNLRMGDNRADIDLKAANLFDRPIAIDSKITSQRFEIDPLLKATSAPAGAGKESPRTTKKKGDAEIGPFEIPVKATGSAIVDTALYKGLEVENFDLAYRLENNVLTVEHMTGEVAGGNFTKNARVDLGRKGLDYQADVNVKAVKANPFVSAFAPKAADTVFGELFFDLKAQGQGVQTEAIKRNLSGRGDLRLLNGKITGAGLVKELAGFLDLEKLRVLRFSEVKGNYVIEEGKVKIDSDFSGSDVKMHPTGTIGLDGSLNLSLDARLSPEYADRLDESGSVTQFFKDDQGWARLPLKVGGSLTEPDYSLDTSAAGQQLKEKATRELQKKIRDKVFNGSSSKEEENESREEPEKEMLRELKGIFGN